MTPIHDYKDSSTDSQPIGLLGAIFWAAVVITALLFFIPALLSEIGRILS